MYIKKVIIIFLISNILISAELPLKETTARIQLQKAFPLKEQEAINAYKAVIKYFPDNKKEIAVAKNNMARIYNTIGQHSAAEKLYKELLNSKEGLIKGVYINGLLESKNIKYGTEEAFDEAGKLSKEFPQFEIDIQISFVYNALLHFIIKEPKKNTLNKVNLILKDIFLNKKVTTQQSMIIRNFISQIPIIEIYSQIRNNKNKYKGSMVELIGGYVNYTTNFNGLPGLFHSDSLINSETGIAYAVKQHHNVLNSSLKVLKFSQQSLTIQQKNAIEYLEKIISVKHIFLLQNILKNIPEGKTKLRLEKIFKTFNNSLPPKIIDIELEKLKKYKKIISTIDSLQAPNDTKALGKIRNFINQKKYEQTFLNMFNKKTALNNDEARILREYNIWRENNSILGNTRGVKLLFLKSEELK